jgi:hypothetical protein
VQKMLNITPTEYHDLPGISSGGIRCFAKEGPLMYHSRYVLKENQPADSSAKRLGRAFHLAMSDPSDWYKEFCVVPPVLEDDEQLAAIRSSWNGRHTKACLEVGTEVDMRTGPHREYIELKRQDASAHGREWITRNELDKQAHMINSITESAAAMEYVGIADAKTEAACVNIDKATGMEIKALGDVVLPATRTIVDFKATRQTTANGFIRDALKKYSYQYQGEWYTRVFEYDSFVIISVRNEPPYEAMVYRIPPEVMTEVRERNDFHLDALWGCYDQDSWHSLGWGGELDLSDEKRYAQ